MGSASFIDQNTIEIAKGENKFSITGRFVIIATGSTPTSLPFAEFDGSKILSSTEALELRKVPEHLIIIGGGFIGVEIGSIYGRLGSKVTIIEFLDSIIPTLDRQLGMLLQRSLKNLNFEFLLNTRVTGIDASKKGVIVTALNKSKELILHGDHALVAIGRRPYSKGLGLTKIGLELNKNNQIITDGNLRTNIENIYAIGDVTEGPMLAHKAEEEGITVAEIIAGEKPVINHETITWGSLHLAGSGICG